jgi:CRISPR-associated protein Cas1
MTEAVYVLEPGSYVRREGSSLKIVKGDEVLEQIPATGLKRLILMGYVSLSGAVLDFLIQNQIETVFMTPTGRFRARLALDEHGHVARRRAQYAQLGTPGFALETAKIIVRGKIGNTARFLTLRARQYADDALRVAAATLKGLSDHVGKVDDLDALRGLEGTAGRVYFEVFGHLLRNPAFSFTGRTKRPPLDPVNALLSFVYTLLTNDVLSAVKAYGLDPHLGSLHEVSYGRPSLACDLVEEYRCFLGDRLVLGLINRGAVGVDDFVYRKAPQKDYVDEEELRKKRPVEMKPAVSRALISSYEEMMKGRILYSAEGKRVTYRRLIQLQAQAFGKYLESGEGPYSPFVWET